MIKNNLVFWKDAVKASRNDANEGKQVWISPKKIVYSLNILL